MIGHDPQYAGATRQGRHPGWGDGPAVQPDAGARLSTHLGNGAHPLIRRHPNYIWDQLAEDRLAALAESNDCELITFNSQTADVSLRDFVMGITDNQGADDVVVSVPISEVMAEAEPVWAGLADACRSQILKSPPFWATYPVTCLTPDTSSLGETLSATVAADFERASSK